MGIPGVQWESWEYNGSPGSTMGILGVQWELRECNGNPRSTMYPIGVPISPEGLSYGDTHKSS